MVMVKSKKSSERSRAQRSGFKKSDLPFDNGYVKQFKDGRRAHKLSKSGSYHIDQHDPSRDPIRHLSHDVIGKRVKRLFKKK